MVNGHKCRTLLREKASLFSITTTLAPRNDRSMAVRRPQGPAPIIRHCKATKYTVTLQSEEEKGIFTIASKHPSIILLSPAMLWHGYVQAVPATWKWNISQRNKKSGETSKSPASFQPFFEEGMPRCALQAMKARREQQYYWRLLPRFPPMCFLVLRGRWSSFFLIFQSLS